MTKKKNEILHVPYHKWYINVKNPPKEGDYDYEEFWQLQERLCKEGCMVGGVFINPYLYWHLNFWRTEVDYLDDNGKPQQEYRQPLLRDNEWVYFNSIWEAEKQQKGLVIGGIRRLGKSVGEASYIAHGATFDKDSQNVIAGLNAPDIKLITDKIDKGLNHLPPYFQWMRLEDNWNKGVTLGVKSRDGRRFPFSQILIRNLDNGENEEAIAGTKPRKLVIDESAKGPFLKGLQAAMPGFTTPYGWTCSPICTFTGGDVTSYHDAKELMMNPGAYNFLEFPHKEKPGVTHGLFFDATYRLEGKVSSTLADYLGMPDNKELKAIPMQVSDKEKALQVTNDILEQRRLAGDTAAYLKEMMYYPINVEDIFMTQSTNFFNKEAIKKQIQFIEDNNIKGTYIELFHDGTEIKWKHSQKKPIPEYPTPKGCDTDAPIVVWEFPQTEDDKYWYAFTAGVDSYLKEGISVHSDSLGAVYVFKRTVDVSGDGFRDMLVASYVARPENKEYWQEQARLIIKYYNSMALVENDELTFIDYMKHKNDAYRYLAPAPAWTKTLSPLASKKSSFGISRAADKTQSFLENLVKRYLDEVIDRVVDENGSVVSEILGVTRIYDKPLLQEFLTYERGRNADRYVAFSLALAQANEVDIALNPEEKEKTKDLIMSLYEDRRPRRMFSRSKNPLLKKRRNRIL